MSEVKELLATLSQPEQNAVQIMATALDCYNSKDGSGMFAGVERYSVLAARAEVAAVQSSGLPQFWANLLRRMMWDVPPRRFDAQIVAALNADAPHDILRVLATETASIVMLARMVHSARKPEYRPADTADIEGGEL